jgi:4-diphosphocytidyl-2-C-methyl-D-erythritol kinase
MQTALASGEISQIASALCNDLQAPACALHPEIAAALQLLTEAGAAGATMSGSGSTVFGLVPDEARGREAAAFLNGKGLSAWSVHVPVP